MGSVGSTRLECSESIVQSMHFLQVVCALSLGHDHDQVTHFFNIIATPELWAAHAHISHEL